MASKKRKRAASEPQVRSSAVLECGHPGAPNNLIRGSCGTCKIAADWEKAAKTADPDAKSLMLKLADLFRKGKVIYDTNGKNLLEWQKTLSPQSNDKLRDGQP